MTSRYFSAGTLTPKYIRTIIVSAAEISAAEILNIYFFEDFVFLYFKLNLLRPVLPIFTIKSSYFFEITKLYKPNLWCRYTFETLHSGFYFDGKFKFIVHFKKKENKLKMVASQVD